MAMPNTNPIAAEAMLPDDPRPRATWEDARQRLEHAGTYWLATVHPDGRPHVMPILAVWAAGAVHFVANADSRKARNLVSNSHSVFTTSADSLDLVVEGSAELGRDEARLRRVADAYASKYDWHVAIRDGAFYGEGAPTAGPPPYDVYEVRPTRVFGFGTDESFGATRWRFRET